MTTDLDRQRDFALRTTQERGLRFVRLWFTDILGYLKSVALTPTELENAFSEGIGLDGSSVYGFVREYESDSIAKPDAATFAVLPWKTDKGNHHTARMFCDIYNPNGSPFTLDPRYILRKQLNLTQEKGYSCYVHPEIEFFLLQNLPDNGDEPIPADYGGFFDQTINESAPNFRRLAVDALEYMSIPVEFSHHESAPGQQEIDLRFADALSMADNVMTFKYIIKVVAYTNGVNASFMPKPFSQYPGSAMHSHFSLFDGDTNAFYDPEDKLLLSPLAKSFIAGILFHAQDISAITNQWVNSYRRLIRGGEAPFTACWGSTNKSALVRVPLYSYEASATRRIEVRSPDPACNPYLAFAVILAAGLKGIDEGYELPPESQPDLWKLNYHERKKLGYKDLPQSLAEALVYMEESELVAQTLGDEVFELFLRTKWDEYKKFNAEVTSFERKKYLTL